MGAGTSKRPNWYPGEPAAAGDCTCDQKPQQRAWNDPGPPKITGNVQERSTTSLPEVELTDWQFIGNGSFCSVYSCKYRGWPIVAKRVRGDLPRSERREALTNMWNEYDCLTPLSHPNVIDVYGMCRLKKPTDGMSLDEVDVCLLLERLAFGTVGHLLGTTYRLEKNLASTLAKAKKMKMVPLRCRLDRTLELALALEYVHGGSGHGTMIHRDLKSVNVGFAQDGRLKLIDFGLSKIIARPNADDPEDAKESDTYEMTGEVGSYRYMAPELVKQEPYNTKVDIYSWAILSWEILAVSRPYPDISESTFTKKVVMEGERPPLPKSWPARLRTLLSSAWDGDLAKRPSASEIASTLRQIKEELSPREQRRPSLRATTSNVAACDESTDERTRGSRHSSRKKWRSKGPMTLGDLRAEGRALDSNTPAFSSMRFAAADGTGVFYSGQTPAAMGRCPSHFRMQHFRNMVTRSLEREGQDAWSCSRPSTLGLAPSPVEIASNAGDRCASSDSIGGRQLLDEDSSDFGEQKLDHPPTLSSWPSEQQLISPAPELSRVDSSPEVVADRESGAVARAKLDAPATASRSAAVALALAAASAVDDDDTLNKSGSLRNLSEVVTVSATALACPGPMSGSVEILRSLQPAEARAPASGSTTAGNASPCSWTWCGAVDKEVEASIRTLTLTMDEDVGSAADVSAVIDRLTLVAPAQAMPAVNREVLSSSRVLIEGAVHSLRTAPPWKTQALR